MQLNMGGMFGGMNMGGGRSLDDNQEESNESGASRLATKMMLMCLSPVFILLCLGALGWNEKNAVCDGKAIVAGKKNVKEVGCTDATQENGQLVMFSCDLKKEDDLKYVIGGTSDFSQTPYTGICLSSTSSMYQCVQKTKEKTKKDNVGGGKTTVKTYTYSKEWRATHMPSNSWSEKARRSNAFRTGCSDDSNFDNPQWPSDLPSDSTTYVAQAKIGAFTIEKPLIESIACGTVIRTSPMPAGWTQLPNGTYQRGSDRTLGSIRLTYQTNSWAEGATMHTVMGKNTEGVIGEWTAPASWLCSGYTLKKLTKGTHTKDELFAALEDANVMLVWILRILFFCLLWASCSCLLGPLEVFADCIPFVGPFLGDAVQAFVCVLACPPALICCLGVTSIAWMVMRPLIGVPLFLLFLIGMCGFGACAAYGRSQREARNEEKNMMNAGQPVGNIQVYSNGKNTETE